MLAAASGDEETVEALIRRDAMLNAQNIEGFSALHAAAQDGHDAIVLAMLSAGANVNIADEQVRGQTYGSGNTASSLLRTHYHRHTQHTFARVAHTHDPH